MTLTCPVHEHLAQLKGITGKRNRINYNSMHKIHKIKVMSKQVQIPVINHASCQKNLIVCT